MFLIRNKNYVFRNQKLHKDNHKEHNWNYDWLKNQHFIMETSLYKKCLEQEMDWMHYED